jgi:acrylyl-CoA reductase (NADPH)
MTRTAKTYKALVAEQKNGAFVQSVKTLQTEDLPDKDLLIRVYYSSLNYKDALSASGHKGITKEYPFTPGIDAAGIVEKSRNELFSPGDNVIVTSYDLGMNTPGGFGQYISVPAEWVVHLPHGFSLKESMIAGTSGLTASIGVEKILNGNITPDCGDVLVTGATGAVGSFATALLAHLGFRVIAATGKTDQKKFLKDLGASGIIHRDEVTGAGSRPLLTSRWVAALDTVGGTMLDAIIRQTEHNGVVSCCGNVLGHELHTSLFPFILRGVTVAGIDSGIALMRDRIRLWNRLSTDWKPSALEQLYRKCSIEELPREISRILKGEQTGKIVIKLI